MSHLEERQEIDLANIRERLWTLGETVENALLNAKRTLLAPDEELAYQTILADHPINRESRACDRLCHTFIARYLPGAGILREMSATVRVNVSLERVGDYAVTMCREGLQLESGLPANFAGRIDMLADDTLAILRESREAFRDGNADKAIALMNSAKRVEGRMDSFYEELFAADDRMDGKTMMAIFVIFTLFKRVADQAKNICDQTVWTVRGIAKMPKVYNFLFLDRDGGDNAQLAAAIGRKNHAEDANFHVATAGGNDAVSEGLHQFLDSRGMASDGLDSLSLAALEHDLGDYSVIISVNGNYDEHISSVPFHTSALNWDLSGSSSLDDSYRLLSTQIDDLLELIAGDERSQG